MVSNEGSAPESTLDSVGPWAVWVGIAILMIASVGLMVDHSAGITDTAPPSVAAGHPPR